MWLNSSYQSSLLHLYIHYIYLHYIDEYIYMYIYIHITYILQETELLKHMQRRAMKLVKGLEDRTSEGRPHHSTTA